MTMGDAGIPTISIQRRYRHVVSDQWPIDVLPQTDELLSSWLHRLAYANGVAPRGFARVFGLGSGMWSPAIDFRPSSDIENLLRANAGVSHAQIVAMTLASGIPTELLLPLRNSGRRGTSTWLQYCPQCLAGDEHPYFRRSWRLATKVSCRHHRCGLRDRCPSCQRRIEAYGQSKLVPSIFASTAVSICARRQRSSSALQRTWWIIALIRCAAGRVSLRTSARFPCTIAANPHAGDDPHFRLAAQLFQLDANPMLRKVCRSRLRTNNA